jgi:hypothetical protein
MLLEKESITQMLPFGLLELDADGVVRYFKPDSAEDSSLQPSELIGHNLYTDVLMLAQTNEFRDRINIFSRMHIPADSFPYTFSSEQEQVQVKVLLARRHEQSDQGDVGYILVHIRKVN